MWQVLFVNELCVWWLHRFRLSTERRILHKMLYVIVASLVCTTFFIILVLLLCVTVLGNYLCILCRVQCKDQFWCCVARVTDSHVKMNYKMICINFLTQILLGRQLHEHIKHFQHFSDWLVIFRVLLMTRWTVLFLDVLVKKKTDGTLRCMVYRRTTHRLASTHRVLTSSSTKKQPFCPPSSTAHEPFVMMIAYRKKYST